MSEIGAVLDRIEARQTMALQLSPNATSLDLLRAVYRNASLPLPTRMRAAAIAVQFEHPKLAVSAMVPPDGRWPEKLEAAVKASEKVLEARKVEDGWES